MNKPTRQRIRAMHSSQQQYAYLQAHLANGGKDMRGHGMFRYKSNGPSVQAQANLVNDPFRTMQLWIQTLR